MYRVRTLFTGVAGTPWYSNLFFDDQDPGGPEGAVAAVAAFWEALENGIASVVQWAIEADVAAISPGTGEIENVFTVTPADGQGGAVEEPLPYANQGLLRVNSSAWMGGRRIAGRVFVPGPTEDGSNNGVPAGAYTTRLANAGTGLVNSATASWVLYSRKNAIQTPVTSVGAAPYWAVLRSRRD